MAITGSLPGGAAAGRGDNPNGAQSGKSFGSFGTSNPNAPVGNRAPNVMAFSAKTRNAQPISSAEQTAARDKGEYPNVAQGSDAGYNLSPTDKAATVADYWKISRERPDLSADDRRTKARGNRGTMVQDAYGNATDARYTQQSI